MKYKKGFYCLDFEDRQDIYYWDGKNKLERFSILFDRWTIHTANKIENLKPCYDHVYFEILYLGE